MQFLTDADTSLPLGFCLKFAVERLFLILELAVAVCVRMARLFSVATQEETRATGSIEDPLRIQVVHLEEIL